MRRAPYLGFPAPCLAGWIDDIRFGRIASFAEIAERQVQGERYIRLLAPLGRTAAVRWPMAKRSLESRD
jgi:hypothetical protein